MIAPAVPRALRVVLAVVGGALALVGVAGLAAILWAGGLRPSDWYVITVLAPERKIPGWVVTLSFAWLFLLGAYLLRAPLRVSPRALTTGTSPPRL